MEAINKLKMLRLGADRHVDLEAVFSKKAVYDRVAALFPTQRGKELSSKEREATKKLSTTLVYGEIKFEPFAIAVEKIKRKYGGLAVPGEGVYYDIGSGTGKPVFAAVLMHQFERAVGIEILRSLHDAALETAEFWRTHVIPRATEAAPPRPANAASATAAATTTTTTTTTATEAGATTATTTTTANHEKSLLGKGDRTAATAASPQASATDATAAGGEPLIVDPSVAKTTIDFVHGDISKPDCIDISDATLLFANSTCFDDALMLAVARAADRCAIGTFFITFTKEVPSPKWMVLESERYSMSWGVATVFIHIKIIP